MPAPLAEPTDEHADAAGASHGVFARRLFTELFGTFLLVVVDCGGAMVGKLAPDEVTAYARSGATGLLILALIYAMGNVSGAHFNPAVTFAFALRRVFPWPLVPFYWLAQVVGALGGACFLNALLGDVDHLGATVPHFGTGRGFAIEVLLTCLLVTVVIGTATRHRSIGPNAAIAAGAAVALCSLFSRPLSGASMNPARSLGPALVSGELSALWIYLTAPFLGATLACIAMLIIHTRKHAGETEAAEGKG